MYNAFFFYFMCKVVENWLQIPSLVEPSVCIGRDFTSLVAYDKRYYNFCCCSVKSFIWKNMVFFLLLKSPSKVYKQQNCPQKDYKKGT